MANVGQSSPFTAGAAYSAPRSDRTLKRKGPRKVCLERGQFGYGFTLRHFVLYPNRLNENNAVTAADHDCIETIFVKSVEPGSAAAEAGLAEGDHVISVNGKPVRSYRDTIESIKMTAGPLTLVVGPKEEDAIQQAYAATHRPESNLRHRQQELAWFGNPKAFDMTLGISPRSSYSSPVPDIGMEAYPALGIPYQDDSNSNSSSLSNYDSGIMTRRRRMWERREEFLYGNCAGPTPAGIPREFYSRPQRLHMSQMHWPPNESQSSPSVNSSVSAFPNSHESRTARTSFGSASIEASDVYDEPLHRDPRRHLANIQMVSQIAHQFESGRLSPDRTPLFKGELARLEEKHVIPNIADRRAEFEPRVIRRQNDRLPDTPPIQQPRQSSPICLTSGNRTVPVGSKYLHVTPPDASSTDVNMVADDVENTVFRTKTTDETKEISGVSGRKAFRQESYLAAVRTIPGRSASRNKQQRRPLPLNLSLSLQDDGKVDERPLRSQSHSLSGGASPICESPVGRLKTSSLTVDERVTRRRSYVEATKLSIDAAISQSETIQGSLHCKALVLNGRKAPDRNWKSVTVCLHDHELQLTSKQTWKQTLDIRCCAFQVLGDYKQRTNVFRLRTDDYEFLLQAEDAQQLQFWQEAIEKQTLSVPAIPAVAALSPNSTLRKGSQTVTSNEQLPSPKSKTWKGKLGNPFKRNQTGSGSPQLPVYPEGATIGVPLELCPLTPENPLIPLIVTRCTAAVEKRGLDTTGVYRVPGNKAAISSMTEALNKGMDTIPPEDVRWNDVNVVSSLLKLFFRSLPDSIFTSEMYSKFIAADKISDPETRLFSLRKLIHSLPEHNLATLNHLAKHLQTVAQHYEGNKMDSKNLAIVFGPTLLGATELVTLVQDASHHCHIVDSIISYADWLFSDDERSPKIKDVPNSNQQQLTNSTAEALLLGNLSKLGGKEQPPKDLMKSIKLAADRVRKGMKEKNSSFSQSLNHSDQTLEQETLGECSTKDNSSDVLDKRMTICSSISETENLTSNSVNIPISTTSEVDDHDGSAVSLKRFKTADEGGELVESCLEKFESTLHRLKTENEAEKGELENAEEKHHSRKDGCNNNKKEDLGNFERQRQLHVELDEQEKRAVLAVRYWNDNIKVRRSESLNKPDRPVAERTKIRRSESLGKSDRPERRTDFITKTEKTETNIKAKLKRTSSKEKENNALRMKRIKRRHTVGGTKDLDKIPWGDNKLYSEAVERQRTSSPDLTSPKLRNSFANELISMGTLSLRETRALLSISGDMPTTPPSSPLPPLESHV